MQPDVAIIGGGPAGCAAALALQARGLSVCVIAEPDHKERPTETAVPALANLLRNLNADEALGACEPCYGIVSAWGRSSPAIQSAIRNPHGHSWFIHRRRFDAYLQKAVIDRGTQWIHEKAQSLATNSEGITISTAGKSIRARWAVVATGSPPSAARLTGQKAKKIDSMVAFWAHLPAPFEERRLLVEPAEQGWWYLCPADGSGAFACFVTDLASARRLSPTNPTRWNYLFNTTSLGLQLHDAPRAGAIRVALTGLAVLTRIHGSRWIAVGDAAAKLDPLGSSGTATALDSGQRGAHAIADTIQGDVGALDHYGRWKASLIEEFTRQRRDQYALEASRHTSGFWSGRLAYVA